MSLAPGAPALALTFDDGPDTRGTPAVLRALTAVGEGVSATFFVIAPRAETHSELIERILAAGHTVGLHCDAHVRHGEQDRDGVARDTERALERLARLGLPRPTLWRTPWGETAPFTAGIAAEEGLRLVGWDVDTHDWRGDAAGAMLDATRTSLVPGATVLAHDGLGPGARRADCAETARYVGAVGALAAAEGLALEALR